MAAKKEITFQVGRDARTGEFTPVQEAIRRPSTTIVQTIHRPVNKPNSGKK